MANPKLGPAPAPAPAPALARERLRLPAMRRGDLKLGEFPHVPPGEGGNTVDAVDALRAWAERHAEDAIGWYQRDKTIKRIGSRALRALAILLVVAGGLIPLLSAASSGRFAGWGYVLLAGAAGCMAFDYFFGVSAGWMRDMATMQAIQRKLTEFRLEWTVAVLGPDRDQPVLLELLRRFVIDVVELVEAETADWLEEFRSNVGHLHGQAGMGWPER